MLTFLRLLPELAFSFEHDDISINQFCGGLRGLARGGVGSAAKAQESIVFTGVLRGLRGLSRSIEKLPMCLTGLRGFFRG